MSITPTSRAPLAGGQAPTLAMVQARLASDDTLSKRQRQDAQSALRTVARALGTSLDQLPAHPDALRDCLKGFAPSMTGVSERRWTNALSLTRGALKQAGLIRVPARSNTPLAPLWRAAFDHIDQHSAGETAATTVVEGRAVQGKAARAALSRFARYCGARDIAPAAVDDCVFDGFLADVTAGALVKQPRANHRKATLAWNRLAAALPGWPPQRVTVPSYSRTYALPWDRFPASLRQDVEAYLARLAGTGIFEDILEDRPVQPLQAASLKTIRYELSLYVSALVYRGRDPQSLNTLSAVVALDVVKDGLRFFLDRVNNTPTAQIIRIARRVSFVAQHWVAVETAHLAALKAICKRLDPGHQGIKENNLARLRQVDAPEALRRLLRLPQTLEALVARCPTPGRTEALLMQTAVAIEILIMNPIRRKNLVHLNLERHLIRMRDGSMHLVIPAHEVKNRRAIAGLLPRSTVQLLDRYLKRYRPLLLTEPSPWLFPGIADRPKSGERLGLQISATIKRHTGLLVHPHLFRHLAAKAYLDRHPGAYGVIRLLHGHKSVNTTTRYYCGAETDAALKHYHATILGLRDAAPPRVSR